MGQVGDADAVFAVKSRCDDSGWLRVGVAGYRFLLALLADRPPPHGAGSYVLMTGAIARRLATLQAGQANLGPLVAALAPRIASVPYAKVARYDGASRVGALGLVREAWGALVFSRGAERLAAGASAVLTLAAALLWRAGAPLAGALALTGVAAVGWGVAWSARRRRASLGDLRPVLGDRPEDPGPQS